MNQPKKFRYLLLAILITILASTPVAILAADQNHTFDNSFYLPIMMKPGLYASSGTLENDGIVEGVDGVGIGALSDTLDVPIQVSITAASAPTITIPAMAQVVGGFYQISAEEDVFVSMESPFILAFPVPAGTETTHLALATLQSGEDTLDVDDAVQSWVFLEGLVDPDKELFLTTIPVLTKGREVFVLVEHPDFDSPPNDGSGSSSLVARDQSTTLELFDVHCVNFSDPDDCTLDTELKVADYLTEISDRIQGELGFKEPRLRYLNQTLSYNPNSLSSLGYSAYIEPKSSATCVGNTGYYEQLDGRLVLCYDAGVGIIRDSFLTLIHEYFHATQFGYLTVFSDYSVEADEDWVIEGMAASVEESYFVDEMLRSTVWTLHNVDITIKSDYELEAYEAQDFWVYYGQKNGLSMAYLKSVLEEGADSQDVIDALQGGGEVLDVYWDWAKNHVMEPEVDYGGLLGTPCQLETQLVWFVENFYFNPYGDTTYEVVVNPLSSAVVKINLWAELSHRAVIGKVTPDGLQALRYKFYIDQESSCESVPDGPRAFDLDLKKDFYVVISNIDPEKVHTFQIQLEDNH